MRTPVLAGVLALVLPACLVGSGEITGVGENEEEEGSGSGSGSGSNTIPVPRVTATVDKPTVTTELNKTVPVIVSLTSVDGFAGDVTLTASLVDAGNVALPNITVMGPASVTLAANGTGTATYNIAVPANASGSVMTGTLKVAVSSSVGTTDLTSAVQVNNFYTVDYPMGTGNTATAHPMAGMTVALRRGTVLKFPNNDNIDHIIHGGGSYPHEGQVIGTDGLPGRTYQVTTINLAPGSTGTLGCHTHGTASYATYTVQ